MKRLRPRTTVLGGAALGLIAGAAVYGAITSASVAVTTPVSFKPAQVKVVLPPPPAAPCAAGQTLEKGVCIVHVKKVVKKVVVVPAPVIQAAAPRQRQVRPNRAYTSNPPARARYAESESESEHETESDD